MPGRRKPEDKALEVTDDDRYICASCIADPVLRAATGITRKRKTCNICGLAGQTGVFSATVLADRAAKLIPVHFEEFDDTNHDDRNGWTLAEVLANVIAVSDKAICEHIAAHIRSTCGKRDRPFFADGMRYSKRRLSFDYREDELSFAVGHWNAKATQFKHSRRYFNENARKFFSLLFDVALSAKSRSMFGATPTATHTLRAGTQIYRARRVADGTQRERIRKSPADELGAPPTSLAGQNRMNAAGVPMFYGAGDVETCIAEVRPSIGDEIAVGLFETTRDLRLFDFTRFAAPLERQELSIWLDHYKEREELLVVLRYLHRLIAQPARAGDSDYIMTQAMAEFLRFDVDGGFEGIIFNSVQADRGRNYAIFSEHSGGGDVGAPHWMPTFPIKPHASLQKHGPRFHWVRGIEYLGDWQPKGTSDKHNDIM